jgi:hypothetical protein
MASTYKKMDIKPGSAAFGERAAARRDAIRDRVELGDLRIRTTRKKLARRRNMINRMGSED